MTPRTVLCFGDSNTHGTMAMRSVADRRRHPSADRWPSLMAKALAPEWEVIAEGHPGRTAVLDDPVEGAHKNALRSLQAILESHRPLDLVIVMLGTNDLKARFGLTAHDIALGVQRVVIEVQRSDCGPAGTAPDVLLAAPVVVTETGVFAETFSGAAAKSAALPPLLKAVATRQATGFSDLNAVATTDPVDGIHLDAQAHAAIGATLAQAVATRWGRNFERT
jgi:lysophospholipase L1-like esterase